MEESCPGELPNAQQTLHQQEANLHGVKPQRCQDSFIPAYSVLNLTDTPSNLLKFSQQVNGEARMWTQVSWITSAGPHFKSTEASVRYVIQQRDPWTEVQNQTEYGQEGWCSLQCKTREADPQLEEQMLRIVPMVPSCPNFTYTSIDSCS